MTKERRVPQPRQGSDGNRQQTKQTPDTACKTHAEQPVPTLMYLVTQNTTKVERQTPKAVVQHAALAV